MAREFVGGTRSITDDAAEPQLEVEDPESNSESRRRHHQKYIISNKSKKNPNKTKQLKFSALDTKV